MNIRKAIFALIVGSIATTGLAASASADTVWQKHHPRREEVNGRLANLNRRIHEERVEGDLTGKQALALHRDVHGIRRQERLRPAWITGTSPRPSSAASIRKRTPSAAKSVSNRFVTRRRGSGAGSRRAVQFNRPKTFGTV